MNIPFPSCCAEVDELDLFHSVNFSRLEMDSYEEFRKPDK